MLGVSRLWRDQQTLECPALAGLSVCLKSYDLYGRHSKNQSGAKPLAGLREKVKVLGEQ